MKNLKNETWFITGASTGFGKAFAEYAISKGYQVVATARSFDKLKAIQDLAPGLVEIIKMDVTKPAEVKSAVEQALKRFGNIDVLMNNAGYGLVGAVEETSDAELRALMETNFFGAVNVIRELLPHFRKQRSGSIVNITSLGGQLSIAGYSAYAASKFALEGVSEALAGEMTHFNVKVMIAEPGAFRTEFSAGPLKCMPTHEAYKDITGPTREATIAMDKVQGGDPFKAAAAIDFALKSPRTPLRLQLGADSIAAIKNHSETLLKDLLEWEPVGSATQI